MVLERDSLDAVLRRPAFPHSWAEYGKVAHDALLACLDGASIALVNKTPLRAEALGALPGLRLVAVAATGTDNVDLAACAARGITVSNVRGYAEHTVPEHAFALILALRRNLVAWREDVKRGLWQKADTFCLGGHAVRDLHGATLGIFGEGSIGQGLHRLAAGPRHVRREDEVRQVELEQRVALPRRLRAQHVEARPRDPALAQRIGQRQLVDQAAARGVDEQSVAFHPAQLFRADQIARFFCQRTM